MKIYYIFCTLLWLLIATVVLWPTPMAKDKIQPKYEVIVPYATNIREKYFELVIIQKPNGKPLISKEK